MGPSEEELTDIADLGRAIRERLDDEPVVVQLRAVRRTLLDHVAWRNRVRANDWVRHRRPRLSWALAALGLATTAALLLTLRRPIGFQVGGTGAQGRTGDVIEATGGAPLALNFSEGSSIVVQEGGRLRVLTAEAAGAHVLVETGAVDVAIAHRRAGKTRWSFDLGPFRVLVTGTKFRAGWDPTHESFSLAMREGSVMVGGRCVDKPRVVLAGETLNLSCLPTLTRPQLVVPAPGAARVEPQSGVTPPASAPEHTLGNWRALLLSGRLRESLRSADGAGFERVCRDASPRELLMLADAARLSDRTGRAIEALTILRSRFPQTIDAANAAFALGRLAYERRHAHGDAARWFSIYLDEQPAGALMGDAMGRLMEARQRASGTQGARTDAERYLRRFPEGPYAREARAILADQ